MKRVRSWTNSVPEPVCKMSCQNDAHSIERVARGINRIVYSKIDEKEKEYTKPLVKRTKGGTIMTLTIELTPEQEARLAEAAQREGIEPGALAQKLVADHLPPAIEQDPTLALFEQWRQEEALLTPEEIEQESRLWESVEHGINAARAEQGMRLL